MHEFELEGREFIELHNLLKVIGLVHSGGLAKTLIAEGLVKVDGAVEFKKRGRPTILCVVYLHMNMI